MNYLKFLVILSTIFSFLHASEEPVKKPYGMHFMWFNENLVPTQRYITPDAAWCSRDFFFTMIGPNGDKLVDSLVQWGLKNMTYDTDGEHTLVDYIARTT